MRPGRWIVVEQQHNAVFVALVEDVSGDNPGNDEACAVSAIEHSGLIADPGTAT
jgi:hypothetical protein